MKKIFSVWAILAGCFATASAQVGSDNDLLQFFPHTEGSQLVSTTYDANNNVIATTTQTIKDANEFYRGSQITVAFSMVAPNGTVIDQGNYYARYDDQNFYLDMSNRTAIPNFTRYLSSEVDLTSDFLDYPNVFTTYPWDSNFQMEGGEITMSNRADKKEFVRIRTINRDLEKTEKITTPAGTFDAAKISYDIEVNESGSSSRCKGVEWYSAGAGIVRNEVYDHNGNLMNYTVLTQLDVKK